MVEKTLNTAFGGYLKSLRKARQAKDKERYSLRSVAGRIGMDHGNLSRIESGEVIPTDKTLTNLATDLGEDPDVMFAATGRVAGDLQ